MTPRSVVALSGGIGGAKLALGLYRVLPAGTLQVIVNTGDDFDHLGLRICPDVDTTLYTLAGISDPVAGWGRRDETWTFMNVLGDLGGETWFRLGDGDLALHVERTCRVKSGFPLDVIIHDIARRLGITARVLPMSNDPVRTRVHTAEGDLGFQEYFVRRRCEPRLRSLSLEGAPGARPAPAVVAALAPDTVEAIVLCPSNPYVSIDPILAVPGMRDLLRASGAPIVAVTPLIEGRAVKGPTAKIMDEFGVARSPVEITRHYGALLDGFVLDVRDRHLKPEIPMPALITDTLMTTLEDRERLARETLAFAASLRARPREER